MQRNMSFVLRCSGLVDCVVGSHHTSQPGSCWPCTTLSGVDNVRQTAAVTYSCGIGTYVTAQVPTWLSRQDTFLSYG